MNKSKGFSLLEILVAFSILSISLGILLRIFSSGVNTAMVAEEYTVATQIAESLMVKTGIETPLEEGVENGTEAKKYHWRVTMEKISNPIDEEDQTSEFIAIKVMVWWGEDERSRVVELKAVKPGTIDK
jgi:general secretion pathway protein I